MDLTNQAPRSPNELMDGLVSLARMTDKARAFNEGKLGEYHYDCRTTSRCSRSSAFRRTTLRRRRAS